MRKSKSQNKQTIITNENPDYIILDIPPGKQYLCAESAVPQKPQKLNTCAYYARNPIRLRIGKDLEKKLQDLKKDMEKFSKKVDSLS